MFGHERTAALQHCQTLCWDLQVQPFLEVPSVSKSQHPHGITCLAQDPLGDPTPSPLPYPLHSSVSRLICLLFFASEHTDHLLATSVDSLQHCAEKVCTA